jgi:Flp pilus assembly protein TadG
MSPPRVRNSVGSSVLGLARRAHRRAAGESADRGAFAALELVILVPFVLVMLLLVVGFGRVERGRELVDQAAQAAGRAASLAPNPAAAQTAAQQAAEQTLRNGGLSCTGGGASAYADVADFGPGGSVTAHVSCTVSLQDVVVAGFPGHTTLTATATSTIGQYQQTGGDT